MASIALSIMSETVEPIVRDTLEAQNRFISDNMRRIFLLIYRMLGNVPTPGPHPGGVHQGLQRQDQLKDAEKAPIGCRASPPTPPSTTCAATAASASATSTPAEPVATSPSESPSSGAAGRAPEMLEGGLRVLTAASAPLAASRRRGLPAEEVARQLNCSKATVRSHIANARVKFRRYLARRKP